jgi:hypothetical protein
MEIGRERHGDFSPEQGIFQQPATVTLGESSKSGVAASVDSSSPFDDADKVL